VPLAKNSGARIRRFQCGLLVAKDAVVGLAKRGQGKRVGRGAVEDEEHLAIRLEHVAHQVAGFCRPGVVAVADFVALVASAMAANASGQIPA